VTNWDALRIVWLAGGTATAVGAITFWLRRKRTLLRSAAEMDVTLAVHNRLETVTALKNADDPMARAQREETEQFLQQSKLAPHRSGWVVLATLSAILALAHVVTLVCWARSTEQDTKSDQPAPEASAKPASHPTASFEWQSPEPEATATAIEEVPMEAEANSSSGLRDAVLKVEVNGEQKLSQPLKDDLSRPGKHSLKLSVYLDQLGVKTYDVVSYHLAAQRIHGGKLPPTVSPVQFIQVKPMREDTFVCAGGDKPSQCFNYVTAIKSAQLRLMKENFTLANAEISKTSDEWREENSRVGKDQNDLAARTDEVLSMMTSNNYPAEILGLVRQSQPLMSQAGGKILQTENQPALEPQGKALGYLTEVEKYLLNTIKLTSQSKQSNANDPFRKPKNIDLKTHPLTRARKVDELAKEQSQLAGDLASGNTNSVLKLPSDDAKPDAEQIAGTPSERQTEIKRHIEDLLEDPGFKDDALKHLQSSDDLAGKSQQNLEAHDFAAASEPAAEAARELRQTAAALRADDGKQVKNKLADALLQLSTAASGVRKAAQGKTDAEAAAELKKAEDAVRGAAKRLEEEAQRQQANGATNSAARLNEMAKMLQSASLRQLQAQAQQSPRNGAASEQLAQRLDDMAARAAQLRDQGQPSRQEVAHLIERMQRTQANLNNLASQCSGPTPGNSSAPSAGSSGGAPGQRQLPTAAQSSSQNPSSSSSDAVAHARGAEPSREEQRNQLGENLMQELREQTLDAMGVKPDAPELKQIHSILNHGDNAGTSGQNIVAFAAEIDPPLSGLIATLRQELVHIQRQHQLTDQEVAHAPPLYRPAVADYFEQLSRDYTADQQAGQPNAK
jgi:hypothetical protein